MEVGETHLDMLAKPNQRGEGMRETERRGRKKNGSFELGVAGTTSPQRHLVPTWRNCSLVRRLAFQTAEEKLVVAATNP